MCTHEYYVRNIWLENQIRKKWMVLLVVISVADNNCIPADMPPGMDFPYPIRILAFFEMIRPYYFMIRI